MDILGRESFAFDDHTNVHLVAGAGYTARERHQLKGNRLPPGLGGREQLALRQQSARQIHGVWREVLEVLTSGARGLGVPSEEFCGEIKEIAMKKY